MTSLAVTDGIGLMANTQKKVDINTATLDDFVSLVGIGQAKAEAIIDARKACGSFSAVLDLRKIGGIGRTLIEQNSALLCCSPITVPNASTSRETRRSSHVRQDHHQQHANAASSCVTQSLVRTTRSSKTDPSALLWHGEVGLAEATPTVEATPTMEAGLDAMPTSEAGHVVGTPTSRFDDDGEDMDARDTSLAESSGGRSRIPVPVPAKHWMKRKSDGQVDDTRDFTPGKKPCRAIAGRSNNTPSVGHYSLCCDSPAANRGLLRKRIASRTNPPSQLAGWLRTFHSWDASERLLALDELIDRCEPTQVRHMMSVIEPQFQRDFISLLPKELALYVLSFLDAASLLRAAQTCRYWRLLAEDNLLWRDKCHEESIDEGLVFGGRLLRRRGANGVVAGGTVGGVGVGGGSGAKSPWKHLYLRQKQIEFNWKTAALRPPKVLKGHDDHVITCLEFCGSRIVSGSDDNTLKVWSVITGKCLRTLVGHTGGVWSSQMSGSLIISGSTDRTLKVWNADTGQCVHTLYGHTSTVRCLHLYQNIVVSGSRDATLRVWDVQSGHCEHVLMGHVAAVRCVQYDGRRVVSGAYDYMVKVWDPSTETCLHTLQGHTNRVYSLQFDGTHIVSGSLDTSIRVWDVETGNCLHTLVGHQSLTSGMELKHNILVSGNADSTIKVWDITTGQCLQTLQGSNKHQSAVTCLQFNQKFVMTSSDDGTVKIWDVRSGEFVRNLVALESGSSGGVVWRIRCTNTKLVCAVGSRNGTEETKLLVLDFDVHDDVPSFSVVSSTSSSALVTSSS